MVLLLRAVVLRFASAASCVVSSRCTLTHQRGVKWPSNVDGSEEYTKYLQRRIRAQRRQDLRGVLGEGTSIRRPWNVVSHGSQKRRWGGRPAAGKAAREFSAGARHEGGLFQKQQQQQCHQQQQQQRHQRHQQYQRHQRHQQAPGSTPWSKGPRPRQKGEGRDDWKGRVHFHPGEAHMFDRMIAAFLADRQQRHQGRAPWGEQRASPSSGPRARGRGQQDGGHAQRQRQWQQQQQQRQQRQQQRQQQWGGFTERWADSDEEEGDHEGREEGPEWKGFSAHWMGGKRAQGGFQSWQGYFRDMEQMEREWFQQHQQHQWQQHQRSGKGQESSSHHYSRFGSTWQGSRQDTGAARSRPLLSPEVLGHMQVLGVPQGSSLDAATLKAAFHRSARQWHPDKHPDAGAKVAAEKRFKAAQHAYHELCKVGAA